MIIGFDAKRAAQNATGLGNYSRFIISLLAKYSQDFELRLYVPDSRKASLLHRLPQSPNIHMEYPHNFWSRHFRTLWRTFGITRRLQWDKIQVYHGLSNELPLNIRKASNVRTVVTIHDLLFLRYPKGYKTIDRLLYNFKYRRACLHADRIIAVSEFTKMDIVHYYGIAPQKIKVVYQGCDPSFRQTASENLKETVRRTYGLQNPYILYVGSIERRKNLLLLARALSAINSEVTVFAIGRRTPYADEVEQFLKAHHLESRMHLMDHVPFENLPALYQMASVFVYPSRAEGFGIPMLEALCSGTPAIGCTGSCLEEAGGPLSAYVNPDDPEALAREINDILSNPSRRENMITQGHAYAEKFKEENLYADLNKVYSEISQ